MSRKAGGFIGRELRKAIDDVRPVLADLRCDCAPRGKCKLGRPRSKCFRWLAAALWRDIEDLEALNNG